jgi:hypothetical protein
LGIGIAQIFTHREAKSHRENVGYKQYRSFHVT